MFFVIILASFGVQIIYRLRKSVEIQKKRCEATYCYCDLEDKIIDMAESPFTTNTDWEEILPVASWADELWQNTHPGMRIASLEKWVIYLKNN